VRKQSTETMHDRLEFVLEKLGKSPNAASLEIGYKSRNSIREVLDREKNREITSTMLIRLRTSYNINPNWILLGEGKIFLKETNF
jgi:hypothetical protein